VSSIRITELYVIIQLLFLDDYFRFVFVTKCKYALVIFMMLLLVKFVRVTIREFLSTLIWIFAFLGQKTNPYLSPSLYVTRFQWVDSRKTRSQKSLSQECRTTL